MVQALVVILKNLKNARSADKITRDTYLHDDATHGLAVGSHVKVDLRKTHFFSGRRECSAAERRLAEGRTNCLPTDRCERHFQRKQFMNEVTLMGSLLH